MHNRIGRAISITSLLSFLLASCIPAQAINEESTETPTKAAATEMPLETPTAFPTMIPSPTIQMQRWDVLLPDDINICKQANRFSQWDLENPDLLRQELLTLLEKEKSIIESAYVDGLSTINLNTLEFDFGDDPDKSHRPDLIVINEWNPIFTSCSYLPFGDNEGVFVLGVRIRRSEEIQDGIIHLAMDDAGLKTLLIEGGRDVTHYEIEKYYNNLSNQDVIGSLIAVVNSKGKSTNDGPWNKSLALLNLQPSGTDQKLTTLITRYFNSERKLTTDEILEIQPTLERCLIPCFGLSLH